MKGYTIIPNQILGPCQLTIQARYLFCILLKHCGRDENCFPGQKLLAETLGVSPRQVRTYLSELIREGVISKRRKGWNRSNTYAVSKNLDIERKGISYHLRSLLPLHQGSMVPPKSTYLKGKGKRSLRGLENYRRALAEKGLVK